MTLAQIQALIVSVDENAGHYESAYDESDAYTVWREISRVPFSADNEYAEEGWRFQVDRFTKSEGDVVAEDMFAALNADERVYTTYAADYDPDTGYIRHSFACVGL